MFSHRRELIYRSEQCKLPMWDVVGMKTNASRELYHSWYLSCVAGSCKIFAIKRHNAAYPCTSISSPFYVKFHGVCEGKREGVDKVE
jgi:hypothetical protein